MEKGAGKKSAKTMDYHKQGDLFVNRLATILLVQSKLLPPSVLGIKDLKDKV